MVGIRFLWNLTDSLCRQPVNLALATLAATWAVYMAMPGVPLWLKFALAVVSLALLPGYACFRLLAFAQPSHYDRLSVLLVSTSLSFSYNFFLNIAAFVLKLSLHQVLVASLVATSLAYISIFMVLRYRRSIPLPPPLAMNAGSFVYVLLLVGVAITTYLHPIPGGYYAEELFVLRKIVQNPILAMDNLSFIQGEPTTYLFVPFYMLISMVSNLCKVDVMAGVQMMWAFTSVIALLCLTKIMEFISGQRGAALIIAAAYLIMAVFVEAQLRSDYFVALLPTPDRYGFAGGVLLYLALFHFLIHVNDEKINLAMFIGLIYLITEVAFVHSREALMVLGCLFICMLMVLIHFGIKSPYFFKTLLVIVVCVGVLFTYKFINLSIAPTLNAFVRETQEMLQGLLHSRLHSGEFWTGFFYELPGTQITRYEHLAFIRQVAPGMSYATIALMILPIYVLLADRVWRYWFPLIISLTSILALSGSGKLLIGALVGSEDLFQLDALIFIPCLVIFADSIFVCLSFIKGTQFPLSNKISMGMLLAVTLYTLPTIPKGHFLTSSRLGDVFFYSIIVLVAVCKLWPVSRGLLTKLQNKYALDATGWMSIVAIIVVVGIFTPQMVEIKRTSIGPVINLNRTLAYDDGVVQHIQKAISHDMLAQSFIKNNHIPAEVLQYILNDMPPQKNWLGRSTAVIMVASNQYSPIVTSEGEYIGVYANNNYFRKHVDSDTFDLASLMKDRAEFLKILSTYNIDYILVEPEEEGYVRQSLARDRQMAEYLRIVKDFGRYMIVGVSKPQEPPR